MTFPMMVVEPEPEEVVSDAEGMIAYRDDGSIEVADEAPQSAASDPKDHDANLAEHLSESDLAAIAEDLIEAFEADKEARAPWERRLARGLEIVGYVDREGDAGAFEGAASVTYPLIAEAVTQFNARALEELFPASGPVKTIVVGQKTPEREAQAERVQEYMNYQITEEDPSWQDEDDRMLAVLPIEGMAWKKVYRDERLGIQTSKFVSGRDVFLPYSATSVHSAPRICHRYYVKPNDLKFEQLTGNWLDVELAPPPGSDEMERDEVERNVDDADGTQPASGDKDRIHTILEFYADYDLPEFEHVKDDTEEPTKFALPYIVTVELDSRKILKIVRNWQEGDERYRKLGCMIPFRFLPGLGFYGFGFLHVIGGLNQATTGALRALLDSAARANLQGGFVSSDVASKIKNDSLVFANGEWKKIDATAEDLVKGFYTPPTHPPAEALFKLLGFLVEAGKSYTSTTEAMTGTANANGPVGTLVQLIEQGSKVFSGIHKRLHTAKRSEYRLLAKLNAMHTPPDGYPYDPGNDSRKVFAQDFGPAVDVLPVSDPNIYSSHQRIAMAQAVLDLANLEPAMYNKKAVHRRLLAALKVPAPEEVLIDDERPRLDPVSENMLILNMQPVKAFPDQVHEAHLQVHQKFMEHPGFGGHPEVQKLIGPVMAAHMAEHLAYLYQQKVMAAAQIPYIPIDATAQPSSEDQLPPQVEGEIAVAAAMAADAFLQSGGGLPPPPPDPAQVAAQMEAQRAEQEMAMKQQELQMRMAESEAGIAQKQVDIELKQAAQAAEEKRKGEAHGAEEQRKTASFWAEQRRMDEKHRAEMKRAEEKSEQQIEIAEEQADAKAKAMKKAAAQKPQAKAKKE